MLEEFLKEEEARGYSKVSLNEKLELLYQVEDAIELWLAKESSRYIDHFSLSILLHALHYY